MERTWLSSRSLESQVYWILWFYEVGEKNQTIIGVNAQTIKNLLAMQETQVRFQGWEDPLEKGMAIHSNILACRILWTEEPGRVQSMGSQRVRHEWATNNFTLADFLFELSGDMDKTHCILNCLWTSFFLLREPTLLCIILKTAASFFICVQGDLE